MIRWNQPRLKDAWTAYGYRKPMLVIKPVRKATLTRFETGDEGTFGKVVTDNGFQVYSLEKPWADNKTDESCIPAGVYECAVVESPKFGKVYGLKKVKDRTDILIHPANWQRQLLGCLAFGRAIGDVAGLKGVMSSRDAVAGFMADMDSEPFMLTIEWEEAIAPA